MRHRLAPDPRGVERDLAIGAGAAVAITGLAIALAAVGLPDAVEIVLLVAAVGASGWVWGRSVGLVAAIAAIVWFAVALTEPAFRTEIEDEAQVQQTLLLIVVSVLAGVAGDVVHARRRPDDPS